MIYVFISVSVCITLKINQLITCASILSLSNE